MNRLISEKNNPQADVYWANEPVRAEVLRQQGIAAPYVSPNARGIPADFKDPNGYWTGFAARARVLIVNKNIGAKPDLRLQAELAFTLIYVTHSRPEAQEVGMRTIELSKNGAR